MLNRTHEYDFDVEPSTGVVRVTALDATSSSSSSSSRGNATAGGAPQGVDGDGGGGKSGSGSGSGNRSGSGGLTMFEALSKSLDSEELSALVRIKLGVDVDEAKEGYRQSRILTHVYICST